MKNKIKTIAVFLVLFAGIWITPQKATAQISVSFQVFYDDLSPYGSWVDNADYGYVWMPNVDYGFTPYATNGYWVFTDEGWTWVSNYSWGWAPFHYGRWFYENGYGWLWAPDNQWGPGWVTWRRSNDYYGWAPIGPGINIDIAYSSSYNLPYDRWTFVNCRHFGRTNINNYYINNSSNVTIINNTTVINNTREDRRHNVRYNAGPDRMEAERHSNRTFNPVVVKESNQPGQHLGKRELEIYRPQVQKDNTNDRKPMPARVVNLKDVKDPQQQNRPQQRNDQQNKQQQRNDQQNKQQQRNDQQNKQQQQQQQQQRNDQQRQQQQRNDQQNKQQQQQQQQQRNDQQRQQQRNNQQQQQQRPVQPVKQQPATPPQKAKDGKPADQ